MILILLILLAFSASAAVAAAPANSEEATIEVAGCTEIIEGVRSPCVIEEVGPPSSEFPMTEEEEIEAKEIEAEERDGLGAGGVKAADASACAIRRVASRVTALPGSGRLQLTVRYATSDPTAVSVGLKARDGKGAVRLPKTTRRLGKGDGRLRLTTAVGDAQMRRVAKAKELQLSLRTPGTACSGGLEQRLRRAYAGTVSPSHSAAPGTVAGSIVWTTSDSR